MRRTTGQGVQSTFTLLICCSQKPCEIWKEWVLVWWRFYFILLYFTVGKTGTHRGKVTKSCSQVVGLELPPSSLYTQKQVFLWCLHIAWMFFSVVGKLTLCFLCGNKKSKGLFPRAGHTFLAQEAHTDRMQQWYWRFNSARIILTFGKGYFLEVQGLSWKIQLLEHWAMGWDCICG